MQHVRKDRKLPSSVTLLYFPREEKKIKLTKHQLEWKLKRELAPLTAGRVTRFLGVRNHYLVP